MECGARLTLSYINIIHVITGNDDQETWREEIQASGGFTASEVSSKVAWGKVLHIEEGGNRGIQYV